MSFETKDDPVLIFATLHHLFFGIHGATSPTYGDGGNRWNRRYCAVLTQPPAWPSEYLRCAYDNNGLILPDVDCARPPTPFTINRNGLPWLRSTFSKDVAMRGGEPLSVVAQTFARFGGTLYVPITRMGSATWARLYRVRAACLKAGRVVDDVEVDAARTRRASR